MPLTAAERIRKHIGESVPSGGTAADTLFTEEEIQDIIERYPSEEVQVLEAWRQKAAALANLVDTTSGGDRRAFSDLHKHALEEEKLWRGVVERIAAQQQVTKIRQIRRDRRDPRNKVQRGIL